MNSNPIRSQWLVYLACFVAIGYTYIVNESNNDDLQKQSDTTARVVKLNTELAIQNRNLIHQLAREGKERRDQTCTGWEQGHAAEIRDLERSYEFYENTPPELEALANNSFSAVSLWEQIRDAQIDTDGYGEFVPDYCDEPGVGKKEPDPSMPKPPPEVTQLFKESSLPPVERSASP